jgi:hypothetical protein
MKKALFVFVLIIGTLVANAQATGTTSKSTTTTKSTSTSTTTKKSAKTPVKVADLQKAITDNVAKDYAGFTIKEAYSVTNNNVVTYDVVVTKGTTTETLVYDKDGKFVKKLAAKAATKPSKKKK